MSLYRIIMAIFVSFLVLLSKIILYLLVSIFFIFKITKKGK